MTLVAVTERGERFQFNTLDDYESSPLWALAKQRYKLSGRPMVCFICGSDEVEIHHRSYANVGHESLDDLVPCCPDHHYEIEKLIRRDPDVMRKEADVVYESRLRSDHAPKAIAEVLEGCQRLYPEVFPR